MYKFEWLQFGVKVAPAIFQQVMDTMLSGLEFVIAYLDDILMNSQSAKQHKAHMYKVFKRIQDYRFKLKEGKCNIFMKKKKKKKYLGQIKDKDNKRPHLKWAIAMKNMLAPENVYSLQSFLGLANY